MKNKRTVVIVIIVVVALAAAAGGYMVISGNGEGTPTNGTDGDTNGTDGDTNGTDGEYVGTGTETYSGNWEGESATGEEVEGKWEFTVDWETGDVSGSTSGDAIVTLDGSVSEGELTAEGEAALGLVNWWGSFSSDGSGISGEWEIKEEGIVAYSGTWSGQKA